MNIVLIGYRCSGKTSVGELLAKTLGWLFTDTDRMIEEYAGCSTESIIRDMGWGKFRSVEREIVKLISMKDRMVIATGGGIVMDRQNVENLKKNGWIIWLEAKDEILKRRMENDSSNGNTRAPILGVDSLEEINTVLGQRKPLYREMGDTSIDCSNLTIMETVDIIIEGLPEGI